VGAPTARDVHGLALSSRNAYLSEAELPVARRLNAVLAEAAAKARGGGEITAIEADAAAVLAGLGFKVDYVAIVRLDDLQPFRSGRVDGPARALVAARLGRTRLIDNLPV
jgi:pantoate--beta-alanine ligase